MEEEVASLDQDAVAQPQVQPQAPAVQPASLNPDIDLSGPIPHVTIRPRPSERQPTPVDYDPFSASQPSAKEARTPTPVDYNPFSQTSVSGQNIPTAQEIGTAVSGVRDAAGRKINELRGRSEDIDYRSGAVPFEVRVMMARAENPQEAQKVLNRYYGPGNYGQDNAGNWWVNQGGKKVAVSPSGFLEGLENFGAGMVGAASPMAGAIAGGTLGATLTPVAPPFGAAVGAGLGAAGGWAMDQLVKYYQGLYDQSPQEAVRHASNEAALNTALAGAMPAVRAVGRPVAQGIRSFLGVTPTTQAMTSRLVEEGARPPIASAAPDFKSWADKQVLRNVVAGDPWEETNAAIIRQKFTNALKSSGASDAEITAFMQESSDPLSAVTTRPIGEALSGAVQHRLGQFQAEAINSRNAAQQQLRILENTLRSWANQPVGRLGQDVADAIVDQRRQFGAIAKRAYTAIDNMTGDTPIFSMGPTVNAARQWVDLAEPGLVPPYIKKLAERDPNTPISFSEAHEVRSNLRELLGGLDLTRTPYMHKISDVANAVDNTFKSLEKYSNLPGQAAQALRNMDKLYGQGIAKFYNGQINQLVRSVKSGLIPDPEVVASTVIRDGHTEAANQILKMVPENVRDNIFKADMRNIILDSSKRGSDGINYLDGMAMLNQIEQREGVYKNFYTPQALNDLKLLGKNLAALDGKLDVSNLPPSRITSAISDFVNRTRQIDEFVKGNPLSALASGSPEVIDRAARALAMPGKEATTEAAMRFFGPTSPEWKMIQKHAQSNLIRSALVETPSRKPTISGDAIEKTLKRYTPLQQEMLFPNGMAQDLKEVAKDTRFLFPPRFTGSAKDAGLSIAKSNITLHTGVTFWNPRTWYADIRWAAVSMMGWLTDRPTVLRFLADSSRRDPSNTRKLLGALSRWIVNEQSTGPGRGKPQEQLQ